MNPTFKIDIQFGKKLYDFTVELFPEKAPVTVANFCEYVKRGHYIDTIFHRLVWGFRLQGGGYTENLDKKETLPAIKNEADNGLSNRKYTIAMARHPEKDSATSQFFINLSDNERLDHSPEDAEEFGYCVFGKVTEGHRIIDLLALAATRTFKGFKDVPVPAPIIKNITDITKF